MLSVLKIEGGREGGSDRGSDRGTEGRVRSYPTGNPGSATYWSLLSLSENFTFVFVNCCRLNVKRPVTRSVIHCQNDKTL